MPFSRHVLVAGQAAPDLFHFQSSAQAASETRPPHTQWFRGGAGLVAHLLSILRGDVHIHAPEFSSSGLVPSSLVELREREVDTNVFTVECVRKLSVRSELCTPKSLPPPGSKHDRTVYVFQDGENHFADAGGSGRALQLLEPHWPSYFIYRMSRPLCEGAVWERVRPRAAATNALDPERLIVILEADDLRAAGVELSRGSSWEKTCEDFVRNIGAVSSLVTLVTCPHLIVLFGCDGLIYHRGLDVLKPVLFFDPLSTDGEFFNPSRKHNPGITEAFIAGFASALVQSDDEMNYEDCIKAGFQTSGRLARTALSPNPSIYDAPAIMTPARSDGDTLIRLDIPSDEIGKGEHHWSLIDFVIADSGEVARQIVLHGISKINIPHARINRLILFDRTEIQLSHTLKTHLEEYLAAPQTKPPSIALFGPRGSGKTFAALQIAEAAAAGGKKVWPLTFDLSDFTRPKDLTDAFHQIRDAALDGHTPFAYFKNFDTPLCGLSFGWLPHLLPVMRDGRFLDGSAGRPIGTALLFFGTSASSSFAAFRLQNATSQANARVVQDFIGCLEGFVDITGLNRRGVGDSLYLFQRAIILRALLEERAPKLESGGRISIDERVLNGLLLVSEYFQGIRSLKSILTMSRLNDARHFSRSALPSETQLQLHVDHAEFMKAMSGKLLLDEVRESLAEQLNLVYCNHIRERERRKPGSQLKTDEQIDKENYLTPWNQLREAFKDSNREHADAIPSTIRVANCFLAEKKDGRTPVTKFTKAEIEAMAIHEKGRWNSERLQRQWKTGPRSGANKTTPYLVPWEDLEEQIKDIDRVMVRSYPNILPPNYAIYRMGSRI
ncbi:hypothetical protein GGS24DRAFT_126394 [Hypoxylon argillaceum]|nr:hypothetical protein GGS24DRAFT_126394 [Hypoxylon argillaceum]